MQASCCCCRSSCGGIHPIRRFYQPTKVDPNPQQLPHIILCWQLLDSSSTAGCDLYWKQPGAVRCLS